MNSPLQRGAGTPNRGIGSLGGRLAALTLLLAAVTVLIAIIDMHIWREQRRLQEGFIAIQAEKFYFGVKLRGGVRNLNATLLDYYLTGNATDLDTFRTEAATVGGWLSGKTSFIAPEERKAFTELEDAYQAFLLQIKPLLEAKESPATAPQHFVAIYKQTRERLRPLLGACHNLVLAENKAFDLFLKQSDAALDGLQRLFLLSLVLLVALAVSLVFLVKRGMLAPLQAQLTESQALIERQEKLAALGALAAGVAHEIRNPLTAIKFRLFSLRKCLPIEFADNEDSRVIREEINRLDHIVKDFLQFARPAEPRLVRVPAERILTEVQQLMEGELAPSGIQLKVEIQQPAWIQADTQQLKQVLINLVQNSAESIQSKGTITLRLKRAHTLLGERSSPVAILSVIDTGKGIPPEVQKRLFDPFFTTKDGGTGLGLAIAARIVEKHGGLLQYKTEANRGTSFEITLARLEDDGSENIADRR
jgi:signal transduction histidine kinase